MKKFIILIFFTSLAFICASQNTSYDLIPALTNERQVIGSKTFTVTIRDRDIHGPINNTNDQYRELQAYGVQLIKGHDKFIRSVYPHASLKYTTIRDNSYTIIRVDDVIVGVKQLTGLNKYRFVYNFTLDY